MHKLPAKAKPTMCTPSVHYSYHSVKCLFGVSKQGRCNKKKAKFMRNFEIKCNEQRGQVVGITF